MNAMDTTHTSGDCSATAPKNDEIFVTTDGNAPGNSAAPLYGALQAQIAHSGAPGPSHRTVASETAPAPSLSAAQAATHSVQTAAAKSALDVADLPPVLRPHIASSPLLPTPSVVTSPSLPRHFPDSRATYSQSTQCHSLIAPFHKHFHTNHSHSHNIAQLQTRHS